MKAKKPSSQTTRLAIEFASPEAANHFASWLCGAGEQDYWQWMEVREESEDGPITATQFDYHKKCFTTDGKIVAEPVIGTKCGRLGRAD